MINKKVYLAGPITGTSYDECTNWRENATAILKDNGLMPYSPMRGKAYLTKEDIIKDSYDDKTMSSINGINVRDYNDVVTSGALLVNLLGAERVSIGTVMEVAWARMKQIPVVLVMENTGNVHNHGMLTYGHIRVDNIEDGLSAILQIIHP